MQIVVADIGNSSIKLVTGSLSVESGSCRAEWPARQFQSPEELVQCHRSLSLPSVWLISSVNDANMARLRDPLKQAGLVESWQLIGRQQVPLKVDLDQPAGVGVDRLLAAFAAHRMFPCDRDTIVIDCGTAMTIDLVSRDGTFRGGVIMAGPATNLLALESMTEALPDLSRESIRQPTSVLGRSTREAMLNGAWYTGLGAIREVVSAIEAISEIPPRVVGTGGGLGPWQDVLPREWCLVQDLVLNGICQIAGPLLSEATRESG